MTTPTPPDEPLITVAALRSWTQETIADNDPFAGNILWGVSIRLWQYGDKTWTQATLPREARLIGELKAKNFWQHPTGASREQYDVVSESFVDQVLTGLVFTDIEQAELRRLAGPGDDGSTPNIGVWSISTTRGPLETHQGGRSNTLWYEDNWGGTPIPLLDDRQ